VYIIVSRSGQNAETCRVMSSPVLSNHNNVSRRISAAHYQRKLRATDATGQKITICTDQCCIMG
jgi:hypothetical protein